MTTTTDTRGAAANLRRVAAASLFGTAIEWYDFFIYGAAAALVLGPQFFPSLSPLAGTLAAFSTFAIGFLGRPLGGVILGHFGDRIGRKSVLVVSLVAMGLATFAIGLLPTYAQIGVAAPILLVTLRFIQGLAVGGEWAGAVLLAVEHAPRDKRGFYGSFPQMGVPAGVILSNLVFLVTAATLPAEQFQAWGWRIPFLLSAVLVAVGLVVRLKVTETPYFAQVKDAHAETRLPVIEVLQHQPKQVLLAGGTFIATNALGYIFMVYVLSYGTTVLGHGRSQVLLLVLVASAVWLAGIAVCATWSDRIGRRPVFLGGSVALALWSLVFFALIDTGSLPLMLVALVGMALALSATYGPMAALFSELFATKVRCSGASLGYQLGAILGGGLAPFIATGLYGATESSTAVTAYMVALSLVSLLCIAAIAETSRRDLADDEPHSAPQQALEAELVS